MSALNRSTLHSRQSFLHWIIVLSGIFGFLSGCLGVPQIKTPIHQSPQGQIILKTFANQTRQASHPTVIDLKLLQDTFRGLRVVEHKEFVAALLSDEEQEFSVFTEQEIQFLAPLIKEALTQATPEEFVWFQLTNQKQRRPSSTRGAIYVSNNLLRFSLNTFHVDDGIAALSSKPSFPSTHTRNLSLRFSSTTDNLQDPEGPEMFHLQAQIGSVAIALNAPYQAMKSQNPRVEKTAQPHSSSTIQDNHAKEIHTLQKNIDILQKQLDGQTRKLRQLEKRLDQNE